MLTALAAAKSILELPKVKLNKHSIRPPLAFALVDARSEDIGEECANMLIGVVNRVVDNPARLDMHQWGKVNKKGKNAPPCGTVACIAGWVVIEHADHQSLIKEMIDEYGEEYKLRPGETIDLPNDTQTQAEELLGLSSDQADWLFLPNDGMSDTNGWPYVFWQDYVQAKTALDRALVTKKRIIHFILTGQ